MKYRPIIFNSEMVRAILEGRKTQTRRVIKPQPHPPAGLTIEAGDIDGDFFGFFDEDGDYKCPYGQPGDRLWVRETFYTEYETQPKKTNPDFMIYAADRGLKNRPFGSGGYLSWKPSIHMPRWASRITLEVTDVRVERLQEISGEDAKAEGVGGHYPIDHFSNLWNSIHKKEYRWADNPFVWVISFKRIGNEL